MENTLFLQSEVSDPYAFYAHMRAAHPVFHDARNGNWAVYAYADCKRVLETSSAHIPSQNPASLPLLNTSSATLVANLARLANPPHHAASRQTVMRLFECMRQVDVAALLARLVGTAGELDWVEAVCTKLPALAVLEAFCFSAEDIDAILPQVGPLTKIMLPEKSAQQAAAINAVTELVYPLVERHLARTFPALVDTADGRALHVSNLVGLLIQSYDAGRGLLANTLLQALNPHAPRPGDREGWHAFVVETLRFDPPIQNTRRVLREALTLGEVTMPEGAAVLVVLASANRDEQLFVRADRFDAARSNNGAHLTFGAGAHACAAHHFSVRVTAEAMAALFGNGRQVALLEPAIEYEPMVNARLPKQLRIRCSHYSS